MRMSGAKVLPTVLTKLWLSRKCDIVLTEALVKLEVEKNIFPVHNYPHRPYLTSTEYIIQKFCIQVRM